MMGGGGFQKKLMSDLSRGREGVLKKVSHCLTRAF